MVHRYSEVFYGWNYDLQKDGEKLVNVDAPDTLWWKPFVFRNKSHDGRPQTIVHLVNSPVAAEARVNRDSKVRAPVRDVTVRCRAHRGRLPRKAWLAMAEPMTPEADSKVQAVPLEMTKEGGGAVRVTVPSVLYLKTVVFEF